MYGREYYRTSSHYLRGNEQGAKGTPTGHGQEDPPRSGSICYAVVPPTAGSRAHGRPLGMTGWHSHCTSEDATDHGTLCNLLQEDTQDHRVGGIPLHLVV